MPLPGIQLTTLAYRDDIPTNWAARPGQDEVSFIHILCFANYQFKQLIDWNNYCPDSYKKQLVRWSLKWACMTDSFREEIISKPIQICRPWLKDCTSQYLLLVKLVWSCFGGIYFVTVILGIQLLVFFVNNWSQNDFFFLVKVDTDKEIWI